MQLHHLRHFIAVAEELNFGRAAVRLNIVQPALSQSIRRLEELIDVRLFERSRQGVALTEAGRQFLGEAKKTIAQAQLAEQVARRAAKASEHIRIGFIGTAFFRALPAALREFRPQWPDTEVVLEEMSSGAQVAALREGRIDFAVLHPNGIDAQGLSLQQIETYRFVGAIPSQWEIAARTNLALSDLADLPFVLPPVEKNPRFRMAVREACARAGFVPRVVHETMDTLVLFGLVSNGLSVSLVAETSRLLGLPSITFKPIADFTETILWELSLAWLRKPSTPAARAFVQMLAPHSGK